MCSSVRSGEELTTEEAGAGGGWRGGGTRGCGLPAHAAALLGVPVGLVTEKNLWSLIILDI